MPAMARELAADFGPYGIGVNAISPGEIETSILSPGTEELVQDIPQMVFSVFDRSGSRHLFIGGSFDINGAAEYGRKKQGNAWIVC